MLGRIPRPATALFAATVLIAVAPVPAQAGTEDTPEGPTATRAAAAKGQTPWATFKKTKKGYLYTAGLQNNHLTVTKVKGGLRFADTRTRQIRSRPKACSKKHAKRGIVVICKVGKRVSAKHPMTIEIVPRLGDDYINTSKLSAAFRSRVLADAGRDIVHTGAGNDFVNGAQDKDIVTGGAGNDWIRTGLGNDVIFGGPGRDRLVGVEGKDRIRGGKGNDRVGGGPGNDRLFGDAGKDHYSCSSGRDTANVKKGDSTDGNCESRSG